MYTIYSTTLPRKYDTKFIAKQKWLQLLSSGASVGGGSISFSDTLPRFHDTKLTILQKILQEQNAGASSGSAAALMTDLVAYYPLDEASGNAIDQHSSHDGVDTNTVTSFTPGLISATARNFTAASTEFFAVPDDAELDFTTAMTVAGWFRADNIIAQMCMMSKFHLLVSTSWAFQLSPANGIRVFIATVGADGGNTWSDYDGVIFVDDTWYHAAMVYDGGQGTVADRVKVYVNGSQVAPTTTTGTWPVSLNNSNVAMRIGSFQGLTREWQGQLQGWAVAGRAWTSADVALHYNSGAGRTYPFS